MSFARSARTRVLPVPHIPDGLTITASHRSAAGMSRHRGIMPDKGKVERPYRYIREDFFLARSFRNLVELEAHRVVPEDVAGQPRPAECVLRPPGTRG